MKFKYTMALRTHRTLQQAKEPLSIKGINQVVSSNSREEIEQIVHLLRHMGVVEEVATKRSSIRKYCLKEKKQGWTDLLSDPPAQSEKKQDFFWKTELYKKAINKWGAKAQFDMLTEECAELIQANNKLSRGRIQWHSLFEEIADVEIMLEQIKEYANAWETVEEHKKDKLKKLENTLNKEEVKDL